MLYGVKVCVMRIAIRASLIVAMLLATIGTAGPAQAYSNAFFHTQSQGSRGVDVLAIQYLLQHHGFTTDKDSVFDSSMASAVRSFQSHAALVEAIRAAGSGHIKVIWFNDPVLIDEGLTRPLSNHDNHLHIRYCELVHPSSLYTC